MFIHLSGLSNRNYKTATCFFTGIARVSGQNNYEMKWNVYLSRNSEMFALYATCVEVLNDVLKPGLWPFKHPRDFSSTAYFSLRMMKIRLLPLSARNLSLC